MGGALTIFVLLSLSTFIARARLKSNRNLLHEDGRPDLIKLDSLGVVALALRSADDLANVFVSDSDTIILFGRDLGHEAVSDLNSVAGRVAE